MKNTALLANIAKWKKYRETKHKKKLDAVVAVIIMVVVCQHRARA